jgi:hypothetical protein
MTGHLIAYTMITAVAAVCRGWVQALYGRKMRLKVGDLEAEGRTIEEIKSGLVQCPLSAVSEVEK